MGSIGSKPLKLEVSPSTDTLKWCYEALKKLADAGEISLEKINGEYALTLFNPDGSYKEVRSKEVCGVIKAMTNLCEKDRP